MVHSAPEGGVCLKLTDQLSICQALHPLQLPNLDPSMSFPSACRGLLLCLSKQT